MSTCKTATPAQARKDGKPKFNIMFLTTSPNKGSKDFLEPFPYVEKTDFKGGPT